MIRTPGIYEIGEAEYNADPVEGGSLRSSIAWKLIAKGSTPRHAWYASSLNPNFKADNRKQFDLGRACHAALFGNGAKIKIIQGDSYRSKEVQAQRDAAYVAGEIPLLPHEHAEVMAMAEAARQQIAELVKAGTLDKMPFGKGETERTLVWEDHGVVCRARLDGLPDDGSLLADYKTTSASADPSLWQYRQMRLLGFDFQMGFYRRGLEALKIVHSADVGFFVQELFEPYLLSFIRVEDEIIMRANEKVDEALKIWAKCRKDNYWPGYSVDGYMIGLTEREKLEMAGAQAMAQGHDPHGVGWSDNLKDSDYSPIRFKDGKLQ